MKCGAKVMFGVGSIDGNDDLSFLLIMDYVESLGGQGYRNRLHKHGHVGQD